MRVYINKKRIVQQMLFGIIENFLSMELLYLIGKLLDDVIENETMNFYKSIPIILLFVAVQILCLYYENFFKVKLKIEYGNFVRNILYKQILQSEQKNVSKDKILNIFNTCICQLQEYVEIIADVGIYLVTMITATVFLIRINLILFFMSIIFSPLLSYLYQKANIPFTKQNKVVIQNKEHINRGVKQILDGFYIIKAYGLEHKFLDMFKRSVQCLRKSENEKVKISVWISKVGLVLTYIPHLIIPVFGGWLCFKGKISVGELCTANSVIWYVTAPFGSLLEIIKLRKSIFPIKNEIEELLKDFKEKKDILESNKKVLCNELSIQKLAFSYDKNIKVFANLNFTIKSGEHVMLMGESGVGKSTLAKILCGIELEYSGRIATDQLILDKNNLELWRSQVAYTPQNPFVYSMSLKDNICMGRLVSEEKFREIVLITGVDDFASKFSEGMETKVGNGGLKLSGGQKKKMALARMLVSDAEIFIMDEPFSSLDDVSVKKLEENLSIFLSEKIVIIITHQKLHNWNNIKKIYLTKEGFKPNETIYI